ncbi:GAF domain-containing protein [Chamaesiphon sp.]|uniref:GAF domain-containing protein n=1 Tax=Chamaesiphon sp. TaxID=2814140 RepID=UPI0035937B2E
MLEPISLPQPEPSAAIIRDSIVVHPETTVMAALQSGIANVRRNDIDLVCPSSIDDAVSQSPQLPSQTRSSCVLIVEDGRLLGILTESDVMRLIAARQDLERLTIGSVMTSNLVTLRVSDFTDLAVAMSLLDRYQIRHLPVVDDRDCLVGLLTRESLNDRLVAALTASVQQQSAELQEQETQIQIFCGRAQVVYQQAKLDLGESQQFLQTVFDTFPLAVFWKDRESRFLGCNHNFAKDANLSSPTEIIGKTDYDLPWGAHEADAYRADDRQTIASGIAKLGIIETQTRADGTSAWVKTNKLPLRNLNGDTIGVLGTYEDITDRKHTETQLHQLSERLSLALKSGALGCWEWDIIKDRLIWDDRMYELYGMTRSNSELDRRNTYADWVQAIHPDDRAATQVKLVQALLGEVEFDPEFRVVHPDGSIHFIKSYGLVQRDERDRPYSTIGINFDISAVKHDEAIRHQTETTIRQQAEREFVLREMTQRIRKSLQLPTIFETAVREIREFMQTDRVGIFKFSSDFNFVESECVAESVTANFDSILGSKFHDPCFAEKLADYYQQDRINVVEDIYTAGLLDCEVQVLEKFQVRAYLVIPLLNGIQLWGLLCIHHCGAPRAWQPIEVDFIKHIAEQIGIAIQQATLYEKVKLELSVRWQAEESIAQQLRQQQTLGAIAQQIRNSLQVRDILATATEQVNELMQVDRATIFQVFPDRKIRAVEEFVAPEYPGLVGMNWEREQFCPAELEFYLQGQPRIVVDVMQDAWSVQLEASVGMTYVKSKIVAPILLRSGDGTDSWIDTTGQTQLWGLLSVHSCTSHRHWQDGEAQLLQQIADQLAIAIQQASLFEQLQQELTERHQVETQLRQSNQQLAVSNQELARATRLKDEFLANMSHELRTPLNAILGMSEGLQDEVFGSITDRQRKSLSLIEKSGKHLLALINDILDLSKIEANKFELELTDVSIQDLCRNSLLFIKELALKKQIRLTTQLPDYLHRINIQLDDRRCRQVLINLLSNAVKFTPAGGSIALDVRVIDRQGDGKTREQTDPAPPQQIVFSIIDTGIGIAPEHMDKLFQSFVQIDSSLSRQYAGTGLGLALVRRIVEMHGGTVSAQSELNRGSCFTVALPFCPSGEITVPTSLPPVAYPLTINPESTPAPGQKAAILVVEDNQANMETMTGYLKSRGYRPIEAVNGRMAIDLAQLHHPDIILMDIQMPGMDGFAAIRQIRQMRECAGIPIVALTALAMPPDRQKCLDAGANEYVTKPVKLSQLVATIESLLRSAPPI